MVPIDSKALVQPVVEAVRKGVPVINIDIRLDTQLLEQAGVEVAFVGPDNFAAAYEVGKLLDKKLRNEDKVAIIEGLAAADNAQQRKRGFIKAIEEKGLRLVASEPADWETEKAAEVFRLSGNFWLVSFKISYLCLPLFYETRTTPSCHPSGCAYRQL